jgi:hypothetical protein
VLIEYFVRISKKFARSSDARLIEWRAAEAACPAHHGELAIGAGVAHE